MTSTKRWVLVILIAVVAFAALGVAGIYFGARRLKSDVERALGPDADISALRPHWNSVEIEGLRIKAPHDWPSVDTLRASRILIFPDVFALFSGKAHVARIVIEDGYVSALRTHDGRLRVVPSLIEHASVVGQTPTLAIDSIELTGGVLEFFDATIRRPPLKIRIEELKAMLGDIELPALNTYSQVSIDGVIKGVKHDGSITIGGWMQFASRDSVIEHKLRGVDLAALQPYLIKAAEVGIKRGTVDLDLKSTVKEQHLHAPGRITLKGLELDPGHGTFMGLPRQAVVGLMQQRQNNIAVNFTLEGRLDDPHFTLNVDLTTRIAQALGESLGISIEGLARGSGSLSEKSVEALGGTAKGLAKGLKELLKQ